MNKNIVCFDVETTGFSFTEDYIIQLAMIKLDKNLEQIDTKNWYIKPCRNYNITQGAFDAHGLTKEFINEHGVNLKDIAQEILDFVEDSDYLTYNGNTFDIRFIYKDLEMIGYSFPIEDKVCYDAFALYKKYHPCTLSTVYKQYTGKDLEGAHDAFTDVKATIEVFKGLAVEQQIEYKSWTETDECKLWSPEGSIRKNTAGDIVFSNGKYKGVNFYEVFKKDPNYIQWFGNKVATGYTKKILNQYVKDIVKKSHEKVN